MVDVIMQLPDELATEVESVRTWLPTIIELGLAGFRTVAIETATELIEHLKTNPPRLTVLDYHTTDRAQLRLQRLLALNQAGMLSTAEQQELDELERIERIITRLKIQIASQVQNRN